jgi:hypothetical protein
MGPERGAGLGATGNRDLDKLPTHAGDGPVAKKLAPSEVAPSLRPYRGVSVRPAR